MKNNKVIIILLAIIVVLSCTMIYQKTKKVEPQTPETEDIEVPEEITTDTLTTEEIERIVIETYLNRENSGITNYRIQSITINNVSSELKEELKYEETDVLAFVEYEVQKNNEEEWIKENQNCFILKKDENGNYFVYKVGSGW